MQVFLAKPSPELSNVINSAIDGRYAISIRGGKLVSASHIPDNVCVIDPANGLQVATMLRESVPVSVWSGDDMSELVVEQYDKLSPGHIAIIDLEAGRECRYVNSPLNMPVLMEIDSRR